jgi:hypothetical protein
MLLGGRTAQEWGTARPDDLDVIGRGDQLAANAGMPRRKITGGDLHIAGD